MTDDSSFDSFDPEPMPSDWSTVRPSLDVQQLLQGLLAELPEQARTLVEKINRDITALQDQAQEKIAQIRERADRKIAEVEDDVENRRKALVQHAIEQLEPLQKECFQGGEFGKALATFLQILSLRCQGENILPDPGTLVAYPHVGRTYQFRVTGRDDGSVWGTDIYTSDSDLGTAAVHAGALEAGEAGIVRVRIVDMKGVPVRGSLRNGVTTMDWGPYEIGFRVAAD